MGVMGKNLVRMVGVGGYDIPGTACVSRVAIYLPGPAAE